MTQPLVTDPVHALYIDDNCIIGTSMQQVQLQYSACMSAYQDAGLVAKPEKCVQPTLDPVEVLGVVIDNASHHITVLITKLLRLLGQTYMLWVRISTPGRTLDMGYHASSSNVRDNTQHLYIH